MAADGSGHIPDAQHADDPAWRDGRAAKKAHDWIHAHASFARYVQTYPEDGRGLDELATSEQVLGHEPRAAERYARALADDGRDLLANGGIAEVAMDSGDWAGAEQDLHRFFALSPADGLAVVELTNLGLVLGRLHRPEEAAPVFARAMTLVEHGVKPPGGQLYTFACDNDLERGDPDAAESHLREGCQRCPTDIWVWTRMTLLTRQRGEVAESAAARVRAEALVGTPPLAPLALSAPFHGRWLVEQGFGGETHVGGNHYAWDFVKVDDAGRDHLGAGTALSDYPGYGAEILAVADGEVAVVCDAFADHAPGDSVSSEGNEVLIEHQPGMFSLYCHLQHGSVRVRVGNLVARGQVIAACGCTGLAESPHLHLAIVDGLGMRLTMPAAFRDVVLASGAAPQAMPSLVPVTGQTLLAP